MTTRTEADIAPLITRLTAAAGARRPLRAISAASAVAAKVAMETGFDALWVSGLEVSTALGLPDENVLGPRDLADTVLALTRTTALPVSMDIDNAGGTPATARRYAGDLTRAHCSKVRGEPASCAPDRARGADPGLHSTVDSGAWRGSDHDGDRCRGRAAQQGHGRLPPA
ncbi:hypothetical protein GCM10010515_70890 [Streptomyces fructofermentans]|uniref:Uncharacterized protein n=1 Tax=Streptomyces fructofermentans TaxID=152141 RepID=A0A918NT25_9ACTN|nr:hypothetical protein GCM10010515_70890 [Streptomyces fructofermentans]